MGGKTMPIFEFKCKKCGQVTEFLEKAGSTGEHKCKKCGSTETEKIFSSFAARTGRLSSGSSGCSTGSCSLS
jgi:putative FmdB family regulatory protein